MVRYAKKEKIYNMNTEIGKEMYEKGLMRPTSIKYVIEGN